jgi:hypothetical protein
MSPSEVVKQPSSWVNAADPAICFFGLIAEFGPEGAVGTALWATERTGARNPSMQSMRPQTDLTLDLPWHVNLVMFLFAALLLSSLEPVSRGAALYFSSSACCAGVMSHSMK